MEAEYQFGDLIEAWCMSLNLCSQSGLLGIPGSLPWTPTVLCTCLCTAISLLYSIICWGVEVLKYELGCAAMAANKSSNDSTETQPEQGYAQFHQRVVLPNAIACEDNGKLISQHVVNSLHRSAWVL